MRAASWADVRKDPRLTALRLVRNWVLTVAFVSVVGAAGYMGLEHWNWFDSLYMSVITLATVGFKEVHPMDRAGQVWTMVLSVAAIGIIFGTVGFVAEGIMANTASGRREARRMEKRIAGMRNHFVVCGYGRVGSLVARELTADGEQVVVLDIGAESLQRAIDDGYPVVPGNGTSDEVLRAAGVERARGLVTCIDSDPENVYVTLSARKMNPGLSIVGRASSRAVMDKLLQAGADRAVSPYLMAGRRIVELALRPGVADFLDAALSRKDLSFTFEELTVRPKGKLVGRSVGELRNRGVFTMAIMHAQGNYEATPADDRVLLRGERLIVSGSMESLRELDPERSDTEV